MYLFVLWSVCVRSRLVLCCSKPQTPGREGVVGMLWGLGFVHHFILSGLKGINRNRTVAALLSAQRFLTKL